MSFFRPSGRCDRSFAQGLDSIERRTPRPAGRDLAPVFRGALLLLLGCAMAPRPAAAATGTNPLSFLQFGAGARSASLAGSVSASVHDATATYWNPAGLARIDGWDLSGTHTEWLQDIRYENVSIARNRGRSGIGFAFATAYASDFDGRDEVGNQTQTFGFSDVSISGSYAYELSEPFHLGATVKYYRESIDDNAADGFAFDVGAQYQTPVDGLMLGAAVRNLGGSYQLDMTGAASYDLPRTIQVGGAYRLPVGGAAGALNLSADLLAEKGLDASLRFGAEYRYHDQFGLGFGYRAETGNSKSTDGATLDNTQNVSFGASYNKNFRFEYAFVPFTSDLGNTHRFTIGKNW